MTFTKEQILEKVGAEVQRSIDLHPKGMVSLHEAKAIIEEEFDEFWDEVKINPKKLEHWQVESRKKNIKKELIQIAAMCVKALMCDEEIHGY